MAQRTLHLDRHGAGSGVTRKCPDKEMYGEVNLDMDARLDLAAATLPGPRTAEAEPKDYNCSALNPSPS